MMVCHPRPAPPRRPGAIAVAVLVSLVVIRLRRDAHSIARAIAAAAAAAGGCGGSPADEGLRCRLRKDGAATIIAQAASERRMSYPRAPPLLFEGGTGSGWGGGGVPARNGRHRR